MNPSPDYGRPPTLRVHWSWDYPRLPRDTVIASIGSCFSEELVGELLACGFSGAQNPNGILYNPVSIADAMDHVVQGDNYTGEDFFEFNGMYHSWLHHGSFSSLDLDCAVDACNRSLANFRRTLAKAGVLVVTLSSAVVYIEKEEGLIVANCHKLPGTAFLRHLLTLEQCVESLRRIAGRVREYNPGCLVVFTLSPVRHYPGNLVVNARSKALLLTAIHEVCRDMDGTAYFPAYEIILDELRDYRFYAQDMLHPSDLAINYIWEQFANNHLTSESRSFIKEWEKIRKAIDHKPFHPGSPAYKVFVSQTLLKMEHLSEKFPFFDVSKERMILESKLG